MTTTETSRDLPPGRPEWGTAAWHNARKAERITRQERDGHCRA